MVKSRGLQNDPQGIDIYIYFIFNIKFITKISFNQGNKLWYITYTGHLLNYTILKATFVPSKKTQTNYLIINWGHYARCSCNTFVVAIRILK